jgi:hypothetical protein
LHHPGGQAITRQSQQHIQRIEAVAAAPLVQLRPSVTHAPVGGFHGPFRIGITQSIHTLCQVGFKVQPLVPGRQKQPHQHTAQDGQQRQQALLKLPKRVIVLLAKAQQLFEPLPGFGHERFRIDWTARHRRLTINLHGADSKPCSGKATVRICSSFIFSCILAH